MQLLEDAVDAGAPHRAAVVAQCGLDVVRGERARLLVEQLDHRGARAAPPVAGLGETGGRAVRPGWPGVGLLRHAQEARASV